MRAIAVVLLLILAGCATRGEEPAAAPVTPPPDGDGEADGAQPVEAPASDNGEATGSDAPSRTNETTLPDNSTSPPSGNQSSPQSNSTGNNTGPRPFEPEPTGEPCNSLELITPTTASPLGLVDGWPLQQLDVAIIADPYFVEANPDDWRGLLVALVEDASAYYEAQFGIRLHPLIVDALPAGSLDSTAEPKLIWDTARGFMHANHAGSEQDYVAVILGADYNDTTAGQVQCVHGAYRRETAYLWSEYDAPRGPSYDNYIGLPTDLMLDIPLKVFMHESAHLLAAHHHYTNCGEALLGIGPSDALAVCGVMINDIGLASLQFSPTNRLVVRSFLEQTGIGEPV